MSDVKDESKNLGSYAQRYVAEYPWADAAAIELWSRLGAAYAAQHDALDRLYKDLNLEKRGGRFAVLRALYFSSGRRLTQFEIGSDAKVTSAHVTYLVDALEKDGLVFRSPHETDRRMTHVELTASGVELCQTLVPEMARFLGEITLSLSREEKSLLNGLLDRLRLDADSSYQNEGKSEPNTSRS